MFQENNFINFSRENGETVKQCNHVVKIENDGDDDYDDDDNADGGSSGDEDWGGG